MERKSYGRQLKLAKSWIIVFMQTVLLALLVDAQGDDCSPPTKIECGRQGWIHYTEAKCVEDVRCCWNRRNIPNCYYKATAELPGPQCLVAPEIRVDCGDPSTKPRQCLDRGCCWNTTLQGKWCYYPHNNGPILNGFATCKCYIEADPLVKKFDGTREMIRGVQSTVLYHDKKRLIKVIAALGRGTGTWAQSTILDSVIISKGSAENKIVFTRVGLKTFGVAPRYDVISATNPLKVELVDGKVIGTFEYNEFFAKFIIEVPYESYYNDGGVCGVCPAVQH